MIATDMHVHSCFSSDSKENPESIIKTAIEKGFSYVYFTDHHDTDFPVAVVFANVVVKLSSVQKYGS